MVRVTKHTFADAYQYEAAIRAANVRGLSTVRGKFNAELLKVDFDRLWLQSGRESLPVSSHVDIPDDRAPIFFLTGLGEPSIQTSGLDLAPGQLLFWKAGSSHYQRVETGRWGAMSLTPTDLATASIALVGKLISPPQDTTIFKPRGGSMERLISLHAEARRLAEDAPDRMARPEVARALENSLIVTMVSCLSEPEDGSRAFFPMSTRGSCSVSKNSFSRTPTSRRISWRCARRLVPPSVRYGVAAKNSWASHRIGICFCVASIWHIAS